MFRVIPGEMALPLGTKREFEGILEGEGQLGCGEVLAGRLRVMPSSGCVSPLLGSISIIQGMGALLGRGLL